jgi:hypothetical protein
VGSGEAGPGCQWEIEVWLGAGERRGGWRGAARRGAAGFLGPRIGHGRRGFDGFGTGGDGHTDGGKEGSGRPNGWWACGFSIDWRRWPIDLAQTGCSFSQKTSCRVRHISVPVKNSSAMLVILLLTNRHG